MAGNRSIGRTFFNGEKEDPEASAKAARVYKGNRSEPSVRELEVRAAKLKAAARKVDSSAAAVDAGAMRDFR
jgi:hypothetical protein